eukprot:Partr_v1_DN26091_c1_g1_i1_m390 putative CHORD 
MADEPLKTCTNKGCGKTYVESENVDLTCSYHPMPPVFHEGLKGWGCCPKRVVGFDEFLEIPGCNRGKHSDLVEGNKPSHSPSIPKKAASSVVAPEVEVYGQEQPIFVAKDRSASKVAEPLKPAVDDEDPTDAEIPSESQCKRSGCSYKFVSTEVSRGDGVEATCVFHPGSAVFHEGSKGWSCCTRKVLEFDEFLKIKGCKSGTHLFVGSVKEEFVECRHDWYQSPSTVTISLYAKNVDPSSVTVQFKDQQLLVDIILPSKQKSRLHTDLFQPIDTSSSSYKVMGTKIEVVLKKSNGISWPSIEPNENLKSWTTFGITGKTGTVGGKEMHLSNDSPLLAKQ